MSTQSFLKFSNYKKNTICVVVLFVLAFVYAKLFSGLRYSEYRQAFFISVYALHLITAFYSFTNMVYILRVIDFKDYKNITGLL